MTRWLPLVALFCAVAWPAAAQSAAAPGSPVDTNVGDIDPRAASLRRVEPGNAQFSYEARMRVADFSASWNRYAAPAIDPNTGLRHHQQYQYTAPGVRALIDRPAYLVKTDEGLAINQQPSRDRSEIGLIPANTVFQLTLPREHRRPDTDIDRPRPANMLDTRVDNRISPLSLREYQAQQRATNTQPAQPETPAAPIQLMPHITRDRSTPAATQPASTD